MECRFEVVTWENVKSLQNTQYRLLCKWVNFIKINLNITKMFFYQANILYFYFRETTLFGIVEGHIKSCYDIISHLGHFRWIILCKWVNLIIMNLNITKLFVYHDIIIYLYFR